MSTADIPSGVAVQTYHHAVTAGGEESKEKGLSVTAVITRHLEMNAREKKESLVINVPGKDRWTTTTIEFSPKGTPRVFQKEEPLDNHTERLRGKKSEGYVIKANDTDDVNAQTVYTAFRRKK